MKCRLKAISRNETKLNLECNLVRPVQSLFAAVSFHHKHLLGGSFKQVFNLKNVNVCKLNQIVKKVEYMKAFVEFIDTARVESSMNVHTKENSP